MNRAHFVYFLTLPFASFYAIDFTILSLANLFVNRSGATLNKLQKFTINDIVRLHLFYKGEIYMYKKIRKTFTLILGIAAVGLFQPANADWLIDSDGGISAGDAQDIVISLKSNPMSNPEMACLAVTFARSLSGSANVTLFVTLDGVSLADDSVVSSKRFKCETPWGEISLIENLEMFLTDGGTVDANQNHMVVCPICWKSRYGDELPDHGVLPGAEGVPSTAIGKMVLDADKILDF